MRVYVAGPMTGIPHHNTPAFDVAAARIRAAGHEAVSPPDITRANPQQGIRSDGTISSSAYAALVRLDLIALLDCDAMVVLPGWTRSKGSKLELAVALAIGLPVFTVEEFLVADLILRRPLNVVVLNTLLGPGANTDSELVPTPTET